MEGFSSFLTIDSIDDCSCAAIPRDVRIDDVLAIDDVLDVGDVHHCIVVDTARRA